MATNPAVSSKIVLFGKNGQLGHEFVRQLSVQYAPFKAQLFAFDRNSADFTDTQSVIQHLQVVKPDIIINATAYTAVDQAESDAATAYAVNAQTPAAIADYARKHHCLLIHYSTDFVFDGKQQTPYTETDTPNPLGVYGRTKLQGDEAIMQTGGRYFIFRTSWVYADYGHNFMRTMLRLAHEKTELRVVDDQIGSPTWVGHIAHATLEILKRYLTEHSALEYGLYNLSANNYTSWHGFAQKILQLDPRRAQQTCHKVVPIKTQEYPTPATRPSWSVLDNQKLANRFGLTIPTWESQLQQCLRAEPEINNLSSEK